MIQRIAKLLRMTPPTEENVWLLFHSGITVPTDGDEGYQTSCLFQHTDGGDGTSLYVNEGDEDSCDFNAVTVGA